MKKITALLLLAMTMTATTFAQNDPIGMKKARDYWNITYTETAAAHNYSVVGNPLVILTAARKDTVNFVNGNYATGFTFSIICTNASNDSTLIIPASGTINGASSYWFVGTYKHSTWYFDGTNYWLK